MAKKRQKQIKPAPPSPETAPSPAPGRVAVPPASGKVTKEPTAPSNPFYGCAILLIAMGTFAFIILWTFYSGWKQNMEIDQFTLKNAEPMAVMEVSDAARAAVKMKLEAFATVATNGKPVTLTLTLEELNAVLVLSGELGVADYRGMVHFTGMDAGAGALKADIRWKMNNMPFTQAAERFLVGQATFKPVIENNALELHIETVNVPGKTVSQGFLHHLRNWPWLNLAKLKPEISTPLGKVTRFEFSTDGTVLILHCGDTVPR